MLVRFTLIFSTVASFFYGSVVAIDLNPDLFCSIPQTKAYPFSVTTHIDWYPKLTCFILSGNYTSRGNSKFRLGGKWPNAPFLFLPQVNNFPYDVIPAENDFFASMSINVLFFIDWGRLLFDYDPRPNYPFRPKPQAQAWPYFWLALRKEVGSKKVVAMAKAEMHLTLNMLIYNNCGFLEQKHPDGESNPDSRI